MNIASSLRLLALAGLSLSTITALSGCSDSDSQGSGEVDAHAGHDHDGHDHAHDSDSDSTSASTPDLYSDLLGQIKELPIEGDPTTSLEILHVHIPNFKDKDGNIRTFQDGSTGMKSMKMPFPLAQGVSVDGFELNDKVMFTFSVDWSGQSANTWEVTKIEKIDAGTVIDFSSTVSDIIDSTIDKLPELPTHDAP